MTTDSDLHSLAELKAKLSKMLDALHHHPEGISADVEILLVTIEAIDAIGAGKMTIRLAS